MKIIESFDNPQYKLWKKLLSSKGVKKERLTLIAGEKILQDLWKQAPESFAALIHPGKGQKISLKISENHSPQAKVKSDSRSDQSKSALEAANNISSKPSVLEYTLPHSLFETLDFAGTKTTLAVVRVPELLQWNPLAEGQYLLLPVGDPTNLGAILRSALAFGLHNVVLLEEACNPFLPQVIRSSVGAAFGLRLFRGPSIGQLKDLSQKFGILNKLIALDMNGIPLDEFTWPKDFHLLIGEEGPGIPKDLCAQAVRIPMSSDIESLNVAVAAGIVLSGLKS